MTTEKVPRRSYIKYVGGVVVVAVVAAAGYGIYEMTKPTPTPTTPTPTPTTPTPTPVTLNILVWTDLTAEFSDYWPWMIEQFQKENPDIKINWETSVWPCTDLSLPFLASGQPHYDIMFGYRAAYTWAKYYEPLDDYIATSDFAKDVLLPGLFSRGPDGKAREIPLLFAARTLFYNKRILEKNGVTEIPKTWDEVLAAAKKCTHGDEYGYSCQWNKESMLWETAIWLGSHGERMMDEPSPIPKFNTDGAAEVLVYMTKFLPYMPPQCLSPDFSEELNGRLFAEGKVAMQVNMPWVWGMSVTKPESKVKDVAAVAPMPYGTRPYTYLPGDAWGIPKVSLHKKEAWRFFEFYYRKDISVKRGIKTGFPPLTKSALQDPEYTTADPVANAMSEHMRRQGLYMESLYPPEIGAWMEALGKHIYAFLMEKKWDVKTARDHLDAAANAILEAYKKAGIPTS